MLGSALTQMKTDDSQSRQAYGFIGASVLSTIIVPRDWEARAKNGSLMKNRYSSLWGMIDLVYHRSIEGEGEGGIR